MSPFDLVAARLDERGLIVRRHEMRLSARCPAHHDRNPSLTVGVGDDDRALVHCHAGCKTADVLDALGLEVRDLYAGPCPKPWTNNGMRRTGATFDRDGRARLGGVRYMPGASNGTTKTLAAKGSTRDLWPNPATINGSVLFVVEGEPDAVTGATLGVPTVAVPGAGKRSSEWAPRLADGRERVVVIADADEPGREAARLQATAVAAYCDDVRLLDLAPERTDGYDLSDFAAEARDDAGRALVRARLIQKAENAPRVLNESPTSGNNRDRYAGRILDVAAALAAPDTPTSWRCEGLAADGFLTVIAGRGGEGKSWLTLALACGVARGQEVAGIRCKKGKALIFDAENGASLIARRLRAIGVTNGLALQPVEAGGLSLTKDAPWFRQIIEEHKPQLVVFDSLRVLSSGSKEDDSGEMEPIITALKQLARDTGCAIVLVHHRGKSESSDYRGSSAILDQTDLLFTLGRVSKDPASHHRRKLMTVKCRIDEEPAPRWLAINADRGHVTINLAEPFDGDAARPRDTMREDVLGLLTHSSQSGARIAKALGRDKTDGTIRRVLHDLRDAGLAEKRPDGWVLPAAVAYVSGNVGSPPRSFANTGDEGLSASPAHVGEPEESTLRIDEEVTNDAFRCGLGGLSEAADGPTQALAESAVGPSRRAQACDTCGSLLADVAGEMICFGCVALACFGPLPGSAEAP